MKIFSSTFFKLEYNKYKNLILFILKQLLFLLNNYNKYKI